MPSVAPRTPTFAPEPAPLSYPLVPTLNFASFKGGVWKTSLAAATAERMAYAGFRVLLVTCDEQEDARFRLGAKASDGEVPRLPRGSGSITVVSAHKSRVIGLLYQPPGPARFQTSAKEPFQVAVTDMPPEKQGGQLGGVFMVTPMDGTDAARNALEMLEGTPINTTVLLAMIRAPVGGQEEAQWLEVAGAIEKRCLKSQPKRQLFFLEQPIPEAKPVRRAFDEGQSVWLLPRRSNTKLFLSSVDTIAQVFLSHAFKDYSLPPMPPRQSASEAFDPWAED